MAIQVEETENVRVVWDEFNPRIYKRDFRCYKCSEWVNEDDTLWVDSETGKATMDGEPYHEECAPEEMPESVQQLILKSEVKKILEDSVMDSHYVNASCTNYAVLLTAFNRLYKNLYRLVN